MREPLSDCRKAMLSNLPGSSVGRKLRSVGAPAPRPAVTRAPPSGGVCAIAGKWRQASRKHSGRGLALLLAALVLLLCSGCQVTIATGVDANADGSGMVRAGVGLDADALRQVPDLRQQLKVDDLRKAGWTVVGPRKEGDGRTWVRASKRFADPAGERRAVVELNGPTGPFKDFRLTRHRSFLRSTLRFSGTVDLAGASALADQRLIQQLASSGLDTAALQREASDLVNRSFKLQVVARLPGSIHSNAPVSVDGGVVWRPKVGERVQLVATARAWDTRRIVLLAAAVLAALAAVMLLVRRRRRKRAPVTPPA